MKITKLLNEKLTIQKIPFAIGRFSGGLITLTNALATRLCWHKTCQMILEHHGVKPLLTSPAYIAPNATIIGEITAGDSCSFWFGSVVRADVHWIKIGARTNVQDLSMLHVSYKKAPLTIGDDVTIGHSCVLHGCTLHDRILVGMGSIIMDKAVIESDVIIGAGSLVTENTVIPSGMLAVGRPAKVVRPLSAEEKEYLKKSAAHYIKVAGSYTGGPWPY